MKDAKASFFIFFNFALLHLGYSEMVIILDYP